MTENIFHQYAAVAGQNPPIGSLNLEDLENKRWLNSEPRWTNRLGTYWVAVKVLGRGGQGIVGHWTYNGADRDKKRIVDIAVKQAARGQFDGLRGEAFFLSLFEGANNPHILKMYQGLHEEKGNASMKYDYGDVHRLFLEYCAGGDLFSWLERKIIFKEEVTEQEMWSIFHCLAKATFSMAYGSENVDAPKWNRDVVHMDLKPDNILLGATPNDIEHKDQPIFKMADFGLAIDPPQGQDQNYHDKYTYQGTIHYLTPEQLNGPYTLRRNVSRPWISPARALANHGRYESATNVWQVGLIMWSLKHKAVIPFWDRMIDFRSNLSNNLKAGGKTIGYPEDKQEEGPGGSLLYSQELRALINECLLTNPACRPSAENLVARTKCGLNRVRMVIGTIFPQPTDLNTIQKHPEPKLSARWYSGPIMTSSKRLRRQRSSQISQPPSQQLPRVQKDYQKAQDRKAALAKVVLSTQIAVTGGKQSQGQPRAVINPTVNQKLQNVPLAAFQGDIQGPIHRQAQHQRPSQGENQQQNLQTPAIVQPGYQGRPVQNARTAAPILTHQQPIVRSPPFVINRKPIPIPQQLQARPGYQQPIINQPSAVADFTGLANDRRPLPDPAPARAPWAPAYDRRPLPDPAPARAPWAPAPAWDLTPTWDPAPAPAWDLTPTWDPTPAPAPAPAPATAWDLTPTWDPAPASAGTPRLTQNPPQAIPRNQPPVVNPPAVGFTQQTYNPNILPVRRGNEQSPQHMQKPLIKDIRCVIERRTFYGMKKERKAFRPTNLDPRLTIFDLKRRLEAMGCKIAANNMRLLIGNVEAGNLSLLGNFKFGDDVEVKVFKA